ncbi:MAG TPA: c-type cytochrome [Gemmatimonadaceae bacterium]|nr:c-type cytochrome [Gemmatimonadaceae bacterium]
MRSVVAFSLGVLVSAALFLTRDAHSITPTPANTTPPQLATQDTTRFVAHLEHMQPGFVMPRDTLALRNPFEGDAAAVATGAKLYVSYNCIDCHGADGSGAMAPAFVDGRWHFGGSPAEVYESIAQGRPDGMPAWGGLIDRASIWRLVSYVRSLERGKDVATENFTGKTVERTGH